MTSSPYTGVIHHNMTWSIGWVAEVPRVNAQARTRDELLDDLRVALREALEMNRADALAEVGQNLEEVGIRP